MLFSKVQPVPIILTKFTPDKDIRIRFLVECLGTNSWREISSFLPGHSARQCRDRYQNFLLDSLPTNRWTPEEDSLVTKTFHRIGPKWIEIAKLLDGRTVNDGKHRWCYHLSKVDTGMSPLLRAPPKRIPLPVPIIKPMSRREGKSVKSLTISSAFCFEIL
jgi:hypothetical protein